MAETSNDSEESEPPDPTPKKRPGTQPPDTPSGATRRRLQATQALFRPDFDDDDETCRTSRSAARTPNRRTG